MAEESSQIDRVERRLKAMGLQMNRVSNGFLVLDNRCNLAVGFVPNMTLDAIESRLSERQRTSDRTGQEPG
jgi:hypothetical protein